LKTVIIIPARHASTRLPGKLLLDLGGKTILERVYDRASLASLADLVCIATDTDDIYQVAKKFCEHSYMTGLEHQSGTDRLAELASKNQDWELIINVQGDEPFINPEDIDRLIELFKHDPRMQMASLFHKITDPEEINNPNNVKVVTDINGCALYFSRAAIPFDRDASGVGSYKKHIGIYAYRRETLMMISNLPRTKLENLEKLEQLRALENGIKIKMLETNYKPIGIDTQEDYEKALEHFKFKM
jgi:3-deoxy-manno-octulosonate cytidylyltransferase (CMP-KDO synthetase)